MVPGDAPPDPFSPYAGGEGEIKSPAPLLGWPCYLSDAIPTTLGTAKNQDVVVCIRPGDQMLFESEPKTAVHQEVLARTVGVRFQLWRYAAVLWRYPTGIATLGGTGLAIQSEF